MTNAFAVTTGADVVVSFVFFAHCVCDVRSLHFLIYSRPCLLSLSECAYTSEQIRIEKEQEEGKKHDNKAAKSQ